ncbi:MAG: DUF1638 domain-containing protein [Clostridiales bacterium]|jgi:hypothetical protein|nr:DUF1638 domain-containing protein [Eubacteriales bacterium]MDH7565459.1 DUF1638 domain-containing protein [Clostridiales bacterium]
MRSVIVACNTISDELNMAIRETGCTYPVLWIESGLHTYTNLLRKRLKKELEQISNVDQILLAFGFCGNALLGLSSSATIIFPKVEDCITLLLGSPEKRRKLSEEMGTYFLTKGWLDFEQNIWVEYQKSLNRLGREKTERIYQMLLSHYKRLGVVETGAYDLDEFCRRSREIANSLNLKHHVIPGTLRYLKKLLTGPWDEEFVTVNPGEHITLEHIYGKAV